MVTGEAHQRLISAAVRFPWPESIDLGIAYFIEEMIYSKTRHSYATYEICFFILDIWTKNSGSRITIFSLKKATYKK